MINLKYVQETTAHPCFFFSNSFLEGPKAALVASKDFDNGHYKTTPHHGIRAFGRVYSAWAYGQTVVSSKTFFDTSFSLIYVCYSGSGNVNTFMMDGKSGTFLFFFFSTIYIFDSFQDPK